MSDVLPFIIALGVLLAFGHVVFWSTRWFMRTDRDRKRFRRFMRTVRQEIREVKDQIAGIRTILNRFPGPVAISGSPLRLTDFGKRISERFGADTWASDLVPVLRSKVRGLPDYQVDEFCTDYVQDLSPDLEKRVAATAYELGTSRENVRIVLGVVLREALLATPEPPSPPIQP